MPNSATPHYERAVEVARNVVSMLEERAYPFSLPDLFPDAIVPENIKPGSLQHALFLFFACGWDSMDVSERVYEKAAKLALKIDLTKIIPMSQEGITHILKETFWHWNRKSNFFSSKYNIC